MAKEKKEKKPMSLYKKSLLLFILVLFVLSLCFLSYVYRSLVTYEDNLIDNYMDTLLKSGDLTDYYKDSFDVSKYETESNAKKALNKLYQSDGITWKQVSTDDDVYKYEIYNNKQVITTVELSIKETKNALGLLKINVWDIKDVDYSFDKGFYYYDITIPENYTLTVNKKEVSTDEFTTNEDSTLSMLASYTDIEGSKTVSITNLLTEPTIVIKDEKGKEVEYTEDGTNITYEQSYESVDYDKLELKDDFSVLTLAENWSLFLTDDLSGGLHGFNTLKTNLIEGTDIYERAYEWATNVDITFVSSHTLKSPTFTNESVDNCVKYNDEAFSCEVKLEKNMRLTRTGEDRTDSMHEKMYFVYKDGVYKLVDMQSIKS